MKGQAEHRELSEQRSIGQSMRLRAELREQSALERQKRLAERCRQLQQDIDTMRLSGKPVLTGKRLAAVRDDIRQRIGNRFRRVECDLLDGEVDHEG